MFLCCLHVFAIEYRRKRCKYQFRETIFETSSVQQRKCWRHCRLRWTTLPQQTYFSSLNVTRSKKSMLRHSTIALRICGETSNGDTYFFSLFTRGFDVMPNWLIFLLLEFSTKARASSRFRQGQISSTYKTLQNRKKDYPECYVMYGYSFNGTIVKKKTICSRYFRAWWP